MGTRPQNAPAVVAMSTVVVVTCAWSVYLLFVADAQAGQLVSNIGLIAVAFAAGIAAVARAWRAPSVQRFWWLLGFGSLFWGTGQAVWTWYETVLGRAVPFPSWADVGYLAMPPLAAAAMLSLPLAAATLAGRVRTILDGLIVAASLLLVSWIVVLGPVIRAGGDSLISQGISLAYPVGDTVVITIVLYTLLRARHSHHRLPASLPMVGIGLVAFAVSDSGFVYLTTSGAYSSGSVIDIGWFVGFALLLLAALRPSASGIVDAQVSDSARQFGTFLPYAAVTAAVITSVLDVARGGQPDLFMTSIRSALIVFLVARQVLSLRENQALTRTLEERVEERTAELDASRQRFAALVQHSSDVVTVVDRNGLIEYQSESCQRVLGRPADEMVGRSVHDFLLSAQADSLDAAFQLVSKTPMRMQTVQNVWQRPDGSECHLEVTVTNLLDNAHVRGLVLNSRDVTDRTVLESRLVHQAFHDSLTTLVNRAMFKSRLEHTIARRDLAPGSVAVLFLDLDGFKEVNDTLGHSTGDELLVQVAERLTTQMRPSDTVARFGGDEFAVLLENLSDPSLALALAERINAVLREPYQLGAAQVHVSASVGIAQYGPHTMDAEQLLRNADLAMYQAKATASGGFALYDPSMHEGLMERVRLEADLRHALRDDSGELAVEYQPLVNMRTGHITGAEALVRWRHPQRGLLMPLEFIPLAESTGLIVPLGEWVLREACRQAVSWQAESGELTLKVSVNVSARQLYDQNIVAVVTDALNASGLQPSCLTLEMTESVLLDDSRGILSKLRTIKRLGVRLAIDDFGTGYSSLSYLHRFPVDVLKIDKSFIERLSQGGDASLVRTIVNLGHSMNLEIVAEGIERPEEMLMLRRHGCTTGQGFYFSHPLSAHALLEMLVNESGVVPIKDSNAMA